MVGAYVVAGAHDALHDEGETHGVVHAEVLRDAVVAVERGVGLGGNIYMTSALGGERVLEKRTQLREVARNLYGSIPYQYQMQTKEGVKKPENFVEVIFEWSLGDGLVHPVPPQDDEHEETAEQDISKVAVQGGPLCWCGLTLI